VVNVTLSVLYGVLGRVACTNLTNHLCKWECERYSLASESERFAVPEEDPLWSKHVVLYILTNNCCVDGKICVC
jgi:hypothetical protein